MATLEIESFLQVATPLTWLKKASQQIDILLIDHAHCEKKAASCAVNFLFRYPDHPELVMQASRLAREELRHFEQVLKIMRRRGVIYRTLQPARYAEALHREVRREEPNRLLDLLLISAIIEARSCERFHALAPYLPTDLAEFYSGLAEAEQRHFILYLDLARKLQIEVDQRLDFFLQLESQLITQEESVFRFHSGVPEA